MTDPMSNGSEKRADLVFEGGGVKGIGLVGALAVLEEQGYEAQNVAGNSAGAVVAALYAAGYTPAELREIIGGEPFRNFFDLGPEDRIPVVGKAISVLKDFGIYEGEAFLSRMQEFLEPKGVRTFADMVHPRFADAGPLYRYKVQVIAADLTDRRMLVLPRDAHFLGIEPDDLEVALAVRMSMSVPVVFEPVRFKNPQTGREHLIVDGGLLSNYPIWLFDSDGVPAWPTFGLRLVEPEPQESVLDRLGPAPVQQAAGGVVDFVLSLVKTMLEAHDRLYIETSNFARTIPIPTLGISTLDFDLTPERRDALYESGRKAAEEFLADWDFQAYIEEFRSGQKVSRRKQVAERLHRRAEEAS